MVQRLGDVGTVFRALGDDTRRDILRRLREGPRTVTELSTSYRMSLPALLKHLHVLESTGLVRTGKAGRTRSCALAPDGLRDAALWLSEYEDFWTDRLDALTTHLRGEPVTEIDLTRSVAAPRERVWRAWTDASELAAWFWPPSFAAEATVDPRVGAAWHIRSTAAGMGVSGVFAAVDAPKRLVFTWRWDGDDEETLVTVTFEREGTETLVRVVHERFGDARSASDHAQGWNDCLDRLPAAIG